ncbi:MAG: MFS transporter [Dehalococcoidales bacterium]|nr:MFS transporter [Dehalococcoidales bacterium]
MFKKLKLSPFILICIMGGLAIFSSTMSKNPALPLYAGVLGIPDATLGFVAAASTIVGILVSFPAAALSDYIGRRRLLLIAAFVFATAPFLYLLVNGVLSLVMVRIYHGLATAILGPIAMAAVADTFDKGRGERMAWYSSATMVGRFLAPLLGGALIMNNGTDFHWVYLVDGILGVLALTAALFIKFPAVSLKPAGETKRTKRDIGKEIVAVVTHRGILSTSLVEAVQYFAYGAIETFLPRFLKENTNFTSLQIGSLFTAQIIVAAFSKPVMGRLSDKYGRLPVIIGGLVMGGLVTLALGFTTNYIVLIVLIALFGLGLATVTASTSALVADLSKASNRGSAMGLLSTIMDIGQSAGPIVTGLIVGAFAYKPAFAVVGILMIAASLVYGIVMKNQMKPVKAT